MKNKEKYPTQLFEADASKLKFTIVIKIHQNCSTLNVEVPEGENQPSYQDVIGQLEISKYSLIFQQREQNIKTLKKTKKSKCHTTTSSITET